MKRVTYYPQVVLGFPFAWAFFICVGALGMDPLRESLEPTLAIFVTNVMWTIIYDTIYAHQDVAYDEDAGVKRMAMRFRNSTKILATVLSFGKVLLAAVCWAYADFGRGYFVGTVGGVGFAMAYFIYDVDLKDPQGCGTWFRDQFWVIGAAFLVKLLAEYTRKFQHLA